MSDKDRLGIPRPFVEEGKGPAGISRPFVENEGERLIGELEDAVADERKADQEYARIIIMLREQGFEDEADRVEQIRSAEMEHKDQLQNILSKIEREVRRS